MNNIQNNDNNIVNIGYPTLIKDFNQVNPISVFTGDSHGFIIGKNKVEFVYTEKRESLELTMTNDQKSSLIQSQSKTQLQSTDDVRKLDLKTRITSVTSLENIKNINVESLVSMHIDFSEIKIENIAEGG